MNYVNGLSSVYCGREAIAESVFHGLKFKQAIRKILSVLIVLDGEKYYRNCLSRLIDKNPVFSRVLEVVGSGKKR